MDTRLGQTVSLIVAVSDNGIIGRGGDLPWPKIREDFARFKALTTGHTVIVGRKTHESILRRLGKPLPERTTVVVTRRQNYSVPVGCCTADSLKDALAKCSGAAEVFVIGGAEIYRSALDDDLVDRIYLTRVHQSVTGDTHMPVINMGRWMLVEAGTVPTDTSEVTFEEYRRKR